MDRIIIFNRDGQEGDSFARRLQQEGYQVVVATSEREALDAIRTGELQDSSSQPQPPKVSRLEPAAAETTSPAIDFIHQPDFDFGPFRLVFTRVQLLKDGKPIPLSYMESKLLMYLVLHRETVVSTQDLMRMVWGYGETVSSGTIYTHVSWLRKKLKTPQMPDGYISTVRNMGYIFSQAQ